MKRRNFLKISGTTLGSVCLFPVTSLAKLTNQKIRRPNILFIMADDHASQAVGCYNLRLSKFAPTQNIDRIGREGAILKNCFCTN